MQYFLVMTSLAILQNSIQQNIAQTDELYFIDEFESDLCQIGNNTVKDNLAFLRERIKEIDKDSALYQRIFLIIHNLSTARFNVAQEKMPCFSELFYREMLHNIDIEGVTSRIKEREVELQCALMPIQYYPAVQNTVVLKTVAKLIMNTTYYGKKDLGTIQRNAASLSNELSEYSYYSIKRGITQYCKRHKNYPSLKELIDVIKPLHIKGLSILANTNFLLSLDN